MAVVGPRSIFTLNSRKNAASASPARGNCDGGDVLGLNLRSVELLRRRTGNGADSEGDPVFSLAAERTRTSVIIRVRERHTPGPARAQEP